MDQNQFTQFKGMKFMPSRIPKRDALTCFIPDGQKRPQWVEEALKLNSISRWYPVPGGHKFSIADNTEGLDRARFTVERELWDHEHCDVCDARIPAMTLCWVTETGAYYILCESCHRLMTETWLGKLRRLILRK